MEPYTVHEWLLTVAVGTGHRPPPGRFPASAPLALRIGTPDQPSIWTRREGQPQQASNPPVNSLTLVLYLAWFFSALARAERRVTVQDPLGVGRCGETAQLTLRLARRLLGSFGALVQSLGSCRE